MCGHVMDKGWGNVTVFNRTRAKAEPLLGLGAEWGDSPGAVAERSDVVFTIVGFPADVREVYLGEKGILSKARPGTILVDMTTTEPSLAREIYTVAAAQGVFAVDAPVTGGDVGARTAQLVILAGGDREIVERVTPLLETMGKLIVYQGPAGSGQHAKMTNQVAIAGGMIGVCEALLYAYKAGLNLEEVIRSLSAGAAGSWTLQNLAPRMVRGNFDPGFFVEHFIKDMGIALAEAKRMGIVLPGLGLVHQLYLAVQAQGHGRKGTHALFLALQNLSNTKVEKD